MLYYHCVVMFRRIFTYICMNTIYSRSAKTNKFAFALDLSVYLTHIIRFATTNGATPNIRYYVSSNILVIFALMI